MRSDYYQSVKTSDGVLDVQCEIEYFNDCECGGAMHAHITDIELTSVYDSLGFEVLPDNRLSNEIEAKIEAAFYDELGANTPEGFDYEYA